MYKRQTQSFVISLISRLDKEDATKIICMFLHMDKEWLDENVSADEAFEALREAIKLNDWSDVLQILVILDTIKIEEVMQLWQTVQATDSLKKS